MKYMYNKLTQRLLAEGYTADNFPDYVEIPKLKELEGKSGVDLLDNLLGGFRYTDEARRSRLYVTPCGRVVFGVTNTVYTNWPNGSKRWSPEDDCPLIYCPNGEDAFNECDFLPDGFGEKGHRPQITSCPICPLD